MRTNLDYLRRSSRQKNKTLHNVCLQSQRVDNGNVHFLRWITMISEKPRQFASFVSTQVEESKAVSKEKERRLKMMLLLAFGRLARNLQKTTKDAWPVSQKSFLWRCLRSPSWAAEVRPWSLAAAICGSNGYPSQRILSEYLQLSQWA